MNDNVFVLGNGPNRKNIDPKSLPGLVIGCNACYRDFKPDVICAIDAGIISEIVDSGFDEDCYFTHDSWNLLPADAKLTVSNGSEHETKRKEGDDQFVFLSGRDSEVKKTQNYIIWVPKKMEHKIKNIGIKVLGWSTGTSAVWVACTEFNPKKVYILGFDHKSGKYDNLYADTKHYYSKDSKQGWQHVHKSWTAELFKIFEWFPNIEFYWVNYGRKKYVRWDWEISAAAYKNVDFSLPSKCWNDLAHIWPELTENNSSQKNLHFLDEKEIWQL